MARTHVALRALLFSSLLFGCAQKQATVTADGRVHGVITYVADGDTVTVRFGSTTEKIRLIGVATPETKHPTKPVECWGPEASAYTTALLPPGTDVYIMRDTEARDKYRRLLAYIYRTADNLFVNYELLAGGWGVPLSIAPNTAFETDFAAASYSAQQANLGLWAHCRG